MHETGQERPSAPVNPTAPDKVNKPSNRPGPPTGARIDPDLTAALHSSPWARATVTLIPGAAPAAGPIGPTSPGIQPGPYAHIKEALLTHFAGRVRLVRDYDRLPVVLVEIRDLPALTGLATEPAVASIQLEHRMSPN